MLVTTTVSCYHYTWIFQQPTDCNLKQLNTQLLSAEINNSATYSLMQFNTATCSTSAAYSFMQFNTFACNISAAYSLKQYNCRCSTSAGYGLLQLNTAAPSNTAAYSSMQFNSAVYSISAAYGLMYSSSLLLQYLNCLQFNVVTIAATCNYSNAATCSNSTPIQKGV